MRNDKTPKTRKLISLIEKLPYFSLDNLSGVEENRTYLRILLSRYEKAGRLVRLKKGIYVASEYIDNAQKKGAFSFYTECISNILYKPSYLSTEYVLYKHSLLTECPNNFTSISTNKTMHFSNKLGNFFYHKVKDALFCGFEIIKENGLIVYKATKAKALFDFLYLRKNFLIDKKAFEELRLNLDNINKSDKKELQKYLDIEGSKQMKQIFSYLF